MSDLIDRESALSAFNTDINKLIVGGEENARAVENYLNGVIDNIRHLPPALGTNLAQLGTDCISRQAAIDVCDNVIDLFRGQFGAGVVVAIKESIEELPSAQPATDTNVGTKHGTNLAEVGTDCISRQAALEAFGLSEKTRKYGGDHSGYDTMMMYEIQDTIEDLPTIQPEIIRCRECIFASGDSRICMKFDHSPIGELDFCSFAERREVTT